MDKREEEKCEKILEIFQNIIVLKDDFYYIKDERLGYVLLQNISENGVIENAVICKTAKKLYDYLQKDWKYDIVNAYMNKKDIYEFKYEQVLQELPNDIKKNMLEEEEKLLEALKYI